MTNARKPLRARAYRSTFLRSPAWFARRDTWFATQARTGRPLTCAACGQTATKRGLEMHHISYARVHRTRGGRWVAGETHDDLVPMHPYCHELLHRLIDRDAVLARHRDRHAASTLALDTLRRTLTEPGTNTR
jgi:hypothetical protein